MAAGLAAAGIQAASAAGVSPARPGPHGVAHAGVVAAADKAEPQQWRIQFEQLLGQHTVLTARLMRAVVQPQPDFTEAATAALQQNTDALAKLMSTAYGATVAKAFTQSWQSHITTLFAYANAVAAGDSGARTAARDRLVAYADSYGRLVSGASKGRIPAAAAAQGVRMHVTELMQQLDAYAKKDYATAYRIESTAFEHMFSGGGALARGAGLPSEVAVGFDSPPSRLRSTFAMLFGQHMAMAVEATRAATGSPEQFRGAAAQLDRNSKAMGAAMGTIVGESAGARFSELWGDHVDGFVAYVSAAVKDDEAGRTAARARLDTFAREMGALLSKAVSGRVAAPKLTEILTVHDDELIAHADAFVGKNYRLANDIDLRGYAHLVSTAETLVDALQGRIAGNLPHGGAHTGGGGTSGS